MRFIAAMTAAFRQFGGKLGPYLIIELLLPGGTLIAFAVLLMRNWSQLRQYRPVRALTAVDQCFVALRSDEWRTAVKGRRGKSATALRDTRKGQEGRRYRTVVRSVARGDAMVVTHKLVELANVLEKRLIAFRRG